MTGALSSMGVTVKCVRVLFFSVLKIIMSLIECGKDEVKELKVHCHGIQSHLLFQTVTTNFSGALFFLNVLGNGRVFLGSKTRGTKY